MIVAGEDEMPGDDARLTGGHNRAFGSAVESPPFAAQVGVPDGAVKITGENGAESGDIAGETVMIGCTAAASASDNGLHSTGGSWRAVEVGLGGALSSTHAAMPRARKSAAAAARL